MATKWGIVSAGKISHDFVTAVQSIPGNEHEFIAVGARNLTSAKEFAALHKIHKAYGSYEEIAKDPEIEIVYIGTINSQHLSVGKLMLENNKHVLCEKPMTLNLKQTRELIAVARKHKRFLMEAIWSRFTPGYRYMMEKLKNNSIGDVKLVYASFGIPVMDLDRIMKKSMGGGTILDLGIYTLNAVNMVFNGEKPQKIVSVGHLNKEGVDIAMASSLLFSDNRTAQVATNAMANLPTELVITGTKGYIKAHYPFFCPTTIETSTEKVEFPLPDTLLPANFVNSSGLRYEAMEVRRCLQEGALESAVMPLKDSETLAEMMDEIRKQIGVQYDED